MKKTLQYITVLFLTVCCFTACKKMDSTYKDFIVQGGLTYTAKVSSPKVYAGRNRIKISWQRGADPNVVKARLFWNNYSDSVDVIIPPVGDVISITLDNLEERPYSFIVKTYDNKGNSSVPVELFGTSYGENFQTGIESLNRPLNLATVDAQGTVTVNWGTANISSGAFATEIQYTDNLNQVKIMRSLATEVSSTIANVKAGTAFKYRTLYLPDTLAIDTFYTSFKENKQCLFDKSTWSVAAFSSQHNTAAANVVTNIIDGNPATRWHAITSSKYPHFVTIDMKSEKTITGFEIFRATGDDRACNTFQLLVSNNNSTWTDLGVFNFNRLVDDGQFYEISSKPKARYFKFVGLTGPIAYMVTGEINVYGL